MIGSLEHIAALFGLRFIPRTQQQKEDIVAACRAEEKPIEIMGLKFTRMTRDDYSGFADAPRLAFIHYGDRSVLIWGPVEKELYEIWMEDEAGNVDPYGSVTRQRDWKLGNVI